MDDASTPWHQAVIRVLDPDRDLRGRSVLEIGTGRGGFAAWLASAHPDLRRLVAADFSRVAVERARLHAVERGLRPIDWQIADIQRLPIADGCFDTVISCETLEHVSDPRGALAELARVLRPAGRLILTTPNYLNLLGLYRVYLRARGRTFTEEGQPINHPLTLPSLRRRVLAAGLEIVSFGAVGHYVPVPGRPPIRLRRLDAWANGSRWLGHHSWIVARKPERAGTGTAGRAGRAR